MTARPVPFFHRFVSALLLRPSGYAEIAADRTAAAQAAAVVCLAAMAQPSVLIAELGAWGLLIVMAVGIVRWLVFVSVTYPIARLFAGAPVRYRTLLSCLGFAEAPGIFNALAFAGAFERLVAAAVWLWLLAAAVVAVRGGLGLRRPAAVAVGVLGVAAYLGLGLAADALLGPLE
jgi:hypothetical protein